MQPLPSEANEDSRRKDQIDPAIAELADRYGKKSADRRARGSREEMNRREVELDETLAPRSGGDGDVCLRLG